VSVTMSSYDENRTAKRGKNVIAEKKKKKRKKKYVGRKKKMPPVLETGRQY